MSLGILLKKGQLPNNSNTTEAEPGHSPNEKDFLKLLDIKKHQNSECGSGLNMTDKNDDQTLRNKEQPYIESKTVNKEKKSPLSNEFKVAAEIYHYEISGQPVSFSKLSKSLEGKVAKGTISKALDVLFDWGIATFEYGPTEKGRPGKLLKITSESKPIIEELYIKYWKNV